MTVSDRTVPLALTPSSAREFGTCGLRFYFGAVAGWRAPATPAARLGTAVHETLAGLFRLPPAARTRPAAAQLLPAGMDQPARAAAEDLIDGLFRLEDPAQVTVHPDDVELAVAGELGGAPVRGRIDRVSDAGVCRITDYKTGAAPAPAHVEAALSGVYAYAALLTGYDRPPDEVELLYLATSSRVSRPVLRPHLADHAHRLGQVWGEALVAAEKQSWTARTSPLCAGCAFRPACPAVTRGAPVPGSAGADAALIAGGLSRPEPVPA